MKKLLSLLVLLAVAFTAAVTAAPARAEADDSLLKGCINERFYTDTGLVTAKRPVGENLTGLNKTMYDLLAVGIRKVAAGERTSAVIVTEGPVAAAWAESSGFDYVIK